MIRTTGDAGTAGGPGIAGIARALWRHRSASRDEILAFQSTALRRLVAHAYERVPYYRDLFDAHGIHPSDIRVPADLVRIPITTRRDLQRLPPEATLARGYRPDRLIRSLTSGSSGQPLEIRKTQLEHHLLYLFRLRANRGHGLRWGDRRAIIGRPGSPTGPGRKVVGSWLAPLGRPLPREIDALFEPQRILEELREHRPDILAGYPGVLARVADAVGPSDLPEIRPRLIFCAGEVLGAEMRERIRTAWRVPIRDFYASHEFNLIASECAETGELHTSDDSTLAEILVDGRPAREGESGEIVATALHSYAMPFIRYALNDVVTRGASSCPCGAPFATIRSIQGRVIDYLRLAQGRMLHPYQLIRAFKHEGLGWLGEFRIAQPSETRIDLYFVPYAAPPRDALKRIRTAVRATIGPGLEINVRMISEISQAPSGKLQGIPVYGRRDSDRAGSGPTAAMQDIGGEAS